PARSFGDPVVAVRCHRGCPNEWAARRIRISGPAHGKDRGSAAARIVECDPIAIPSGSPQARRSETREAFFRPHTPQLGAKGWAGEKMPEKQARGLDSPTTS